MTSKSSLVVASAAGSLVLLCLATAVRAQTSSSIQPVSRVATLATGAIQGTVQDEKGLPIAGAAVSALGATTAVAYTDRTGRFELRTLPPGPYLVRAHLTGFVAPRGQIIDVRPSGRTSSSIALRRTTLPSSTPTVLTAGVGPGDLVAPPDAGSSADAAAGSSAAGSASPGS